jgi:carbamoyltransferase
MNILGISGQERAAAAALVQDGRVVAAIEEEKLARIRHIGMNYAGGLPQRAVQFCLDRAGIRFEQLDVVAYYLEPYKLFHREIAFSSTHATQALDAEAIEDFPPYFVDSLNALKQRLRTRRMIQSRLSADGKFIAVPHHLAHGASAFYASGFERAAVISADHRGDMTTTALMTGGGHELRLNAEAHFPNSIGMVYNAVTAALGFDYEGDWHKPMWLAPTGENTLADLFNHLLTVDDNGLPVVNQEFFEITARGVTSLSEKFFERAGIRPRASGDALTPLHHNLAASLQAHVEDVLCRIAVRHREATGEESLCLAGGVALNSLVNAALESRAGFRRIFVQPAAGNAGAALGAALYVHHQLLGNRERVYQMEHAFLGPQTSDDEIKSVLDNCKLAYEYFLTEDKLIAEVARLLAQHREDYRPFSASVPEERATEFFEPSALTEFLQGVSHVREEKRALIPAAVFGQNLVRVHSVNRKTNPGFWKLLMKFGEMTGVPVLLNTSFNLFGEPVVSTPREAVRGFYCSGIDCLAIGNFLIKK